jgi:hypothetical protein
MKSVDAAYCSNLLIEKRLSVSIMPELAVCHDALLIVRAPVVNLNHST